MWSDMQQVQRDYLKQSALTWIHLYKVFSEAQASVIQLGLRAAAETLSPEPSAGKRQRVRLESRAAEESLRDYDILGRYGGDEFTILFPQTTLTQAMNVAHRFENAVREIRLEVLGDRRLSVSGGVANKTPVVQDIEKLVKAADEALYRAKQAGRGRVLASES